MFTRFATHLTLILLFVFAQIGALTHEISHTQEFLNYSQQDTNKNGSIKQDLSKQDSSKQDKSGHKGHCGLCISFAKVANGLQSVSLVFNSATTVFALPVFLYHDYLSQTFAAYAARAPPLAS
ncbi:MAG: hypothetical protein H7Z20_08790 [Bdellovibrio sp.]|nr:hypothetical protein [Methylotenera sp.]